MCCGCDRDVGSQPKLPPRSHLLLDMGGTLQREGHGAADGPHWKWRSRAPQKSKDLLLAARPVNVDADADARFSGEGLANVSQGEERLEVDVHLEFGSLRCCRTLDPRRWVGKRMGGVITRIPHVVLSPGLRDHPPVWGYLWSDLPMFSETLWMVAEPVPHPPAPSVSCNVPFGCPTVACRAIHPPLLHRSSLSFSCTHA